MKKRTFAAMALIFFLTMFLVIPALTYAQSVPQSARIEWEQPDYDKVNYWVLYWSDTAGGPYEVGNIRIDKTDLDPNQSTDVQIPFPEDALTTYYFVLVAFTTPEIFSENSNEASLTVDFRLPPTRPASLTVTIIPE